MTTQKANECTGLFSLHQARRAGISSAEVEGSINTNFRFSKEPLEMQWVLFPPLGKRVAVLVNTYRVPEILDARKQDDRYIADYRVAIDPHQIFN